MLFLFLFRITVLYGVTCIVRCKKLLLSLGKIDENGYKKNSGLKVIKWALMVTKGGTRHLRVGDKKNPKL